MLEHESVYPAHHYSRVENHEQRCHRSAQPKTAVQENERNSQEGEPNVSTQPALHVSNSPEWNFFSKIEERSENKDTE